MAAAAHVALVPRQGTAVLQRLLPMVGKLVLGRSPIPQRAKKSHVQVAETHHGAMGDREECADSAVVVIERIGTASPVLVTVLR